MSTRCNIIIKSDYNNNRIYLYHHHDGYPEFVGALLQDFLKIRTSNPWVGSWDYLGIANTLVKYGIKYNTRNHEGYISERTDDEYEITDGLHGDVEFVYIINCKARTLRCYEIPWDDETHQDFRIRWDRVFRRRNLVEIPKED